MATNNNNINTTYIVNTNGDASRVIPCPPLWAVFGDGTLVSPTSLHHKIRNGEEINVTFVALDDAVGLCDQAKKEHTMETEEKVKAQLATQIEDKDKKIKQLEGELLHLRQEADGLRLQIIRLEELKRNITDILVTVPIYGQANAMISGSDGSYTSSTSTTSSFDPLNYLNTGGDQNHYHFTDDDGEVLMGMFA